MDYWFSLCSGTKFVTVWKKTLNMNVDYTPKPYVELKHPEWSKNATLYQVNVRCYTPEGTFKAFESHLPKLKDLGIDIIWLMPIHPIGIKNRKGTLGSGYAVNDYYGINGEFGNLDDFKSLVSKVHELGMYIIIDWVANHTAWDNKMAEENPDWYSKTPQGEFTPTRWYDWYDVIDLDYNSVGLRKYMTDALKYWVKEHDIDGYRCDVAGFVPTDFWDNARAELDEIKPIFMLAEWESRDLHKKAFDMTYAWSLYDYMHGVASEGRDFEGLFRYLAHDVNSYPSDAYRMTFVENHDKNTWHGTPFQIFGESVEAWMAFACVVNGMPLVYNGQEAGNQKQLKFFDKDIIDWKPHPFFNFYKTFFALKHRNQALWNGSWGGEMEKIVNDAPNRVISFAREKNGDKIMVAFNFSKHPVQVKLQAQYHLGNYKDVFTNANVTIKGDDIITLDSWKFIILEREK